MSEDHGIKFSLPGENVLTAPDNKLLFNSKYPTLKIHSEGSESYSATGDSIYGFTTVLTTHNLGYRPMFMLWLDIGAGYQLAPFQDYQGTYILSFFGTSKGEDTEFDKNSLILGMAAVSTHNELWGETPVPPDDPIDIDYSWVIFYDPTNE